MTFTLIEHTNYGGDINRGHAKVAMNTSNHACIIDCIYEVDNDWHFLYENNNCLSYDEMANFENWFIENVV